MFGRINVSSRADIDGLANRVPAVMELEEADAEYRKLHEQAIDFCNLDQGKPPSLDNVMQICHGEAAYESFVNADFSLLEILLITFSQL